MTPEQIAIVRGSVAAMGPSKDDLAAAFYRHLFGLDPSLREALTEQRDTQDALFTKTLTEIVDSMDSFGELVERSRSLGQALAAHGVRVSHYATGRAAIMAALEEVLGERFDSPTRGRVGARLQPGGRVHDGRRLAAVTLRRRSDQHCGVSFAKWLRIAPLRPISVGTRQQLSIGCSCLLLLRSKY